MARAIAGHSGDAGVPRVRVRQLDNERHFPVIVNETLANEPFVSNPRAQLCHMKIAQVHRLFRERLVKPHHQRLILGPEIHWHDHPPALVGEALSERKLLLSRIAPGGKRRFGKPNQSADWQPTQFSGVQADDHCG